jgi:hypothetical protein
VRGVSGAEGAISELEQLGPRSAIARAIVRRLAAEMSARTRADLERFGLPRPGLTPERPEA